MKIPNTLKSRIDNATALRKSGDAGAESARLTLISLLQEFPDNVDVLIQTAFTHDGLGLEAAAVPFYERAIELGLSSKPNAADVYLGLGSTYRVLGRYEDAQRILSAACEMFPENHALPVFLAMVEYNLQNFETAMRHLLTVISKTTADPSLTPYKRAIDFYADKLNQTWI